MTETNPVIVPRAEWDAMQEDLIRAREALERLRDKIADDEEGDDDDD